MIAIAVETKPITQLRCPSCGKRLLDWNVRLRPGEMVTTKCPSCKQMVTITGQDDV